VRAKEETIGARFLCRPSCALERRSLGDPHRVRCGTVPRRARGGPDARERELKEVLRRVSETREEGESIVDALSFEDCARAGDGGGIEGGSVRRRRIIGEEMGEPGLRCR
jgi:hypothetical protein